MTTLGEKTDKVLIPAAEGMTLQVLRMHIQKRHKPRLGFWSYLSHAQDHAHRPRELDHVHKPNGDAA